MAELQRNIENLSSECREKEGELLDREDFLVSVSYHALHNDAIIITRAMLS